MLLLRHFNVLKVQYYKYCDVRMFLLLPIFCCYFFLIYLFVTAKAALPKKSLVFAVRQITNNLASIAKNCNFIFWPFAKYY